MLVRVLQPLGDPAHPRPGCLGARVPSAHARPAACWTGWPGPAERGAHKLRRPRSGAGPGPWAP